MTSTPHTHRRRKQVVATALTWAVLWQALTPAYAAVSQLPGIYLAPPDPNVMFTLDDSGSMGSDAIPDFLSDRSGMPDTADSNALNQNNATFPGMWKLGSRYLSTTYYRLDNAIARYLRSSAGNPLYYDPTVTYTPWPTPDDNSVTYANADPRRVNIDSSFPSPPLAATIDLTVRRGAAGGDDPASNFWPATYFVYTGATMPAARPNNTLNVQGSFTKLEIKSATATPTFARASTRTDCNGAVGATGCTYQQELQNFANWLQYYRSRMLMAKGGVATAFAQQGTKLRVGFTTINTGAIVLRGVAQFTGANRQAFFTDLYAQDANGGTPLRLAMDQVGRYFQGGTARGNPWAENTSNRQAALSDSCRKSFHIMSTDGFWNGSDAAAPANANNDMYGNSGTPERTPAQPAPDNRTFQYTDNGTPGTQAARFTINPFRDNNASTGSTLADVAAYYWKTDLQPTVENRLSPSTRDPAFWQHLTTFTVGLGISGTGDVRPVDPALSTIHPVTGQQVVTASPSAYSAFAGKPWLSDPALRDLLVARRTPMQWTIPSADAPTTGDDLIHAAMNGRGRYFSATNPTQLATGITSALAEATNQNSSLTTVGLNNTIVTTTTNRLFQAVYNPYGWSGRVYAFDVPVNGNINTEPANSIWEVSRMMPAPATRNIYTWNTALPVAAAAPFTQAGLNSAQWNTLGANNTERLNVLNYLRGDAANEIQNNGTLRDRVRDERSPGVPGGVLGDVVGGSPVKGPDFGGGYQRMRVGAPGRDTYTTFRTTELSTSRIRSMRQSLFFGANDGMLHTVNIENGVERFAFVPNSVFSVPRTRYDGTTATVNKLYQLSRPDYSHLFTANGSPQIGDAFIGATPASASWKSVLVASTGAGARSVYAMDVTNTEVGNGSDNFGLNKILWELSETNSADMGHMPSYPHVAKMQDGTWVAMFGNGYDSSSGRAKLYLVDLQTGQIIWEPTVGPLTGNGLSQPNFLMNQYREVVGIWAGDLRGNMWKFDVNSPVRANWRVAYNGNPLFTTPTNQPITVMPQLSRFQSTSQVMVTFGTGKLFDLEDTATNSTNVNLTRQAIYGLWDNETTSITGVSQLVEQTVGTSALNGFRGTSRNTVDWATRRGWYLQLDNGTGERVHVNPIIPFTSPSTPVFVVANTPSSEPCSSGGSTRLFALDPLTGQAPAFAVFDADQSGAVSAGGDGGYNVYASSSGVATTPSFVGGSMPTDMTINTNVPGSNAQIGGTTANTDGDGDCISNALGFLPNSNTGVDKLLIGGPVCRPRISWRQLK